MEENDTIWQLFEDYQSGSLSSEGVIDFEKQLQSDATFKGQFEAYQLTEQIIVGHQLLDLKKQMEKDLKPRNGKGFIYTLGAGLAVLMVVGYYKISEKHKIKSNIGDSLAVKNVAVSGNISKIEPKFSDNKKIVNNPKTVIQKIDAITQSSKIDSTSDSKIELVDSETIAITKAIEIPIIPKAKDTPKYDPCKNLLFEASVETKAACENANNGIIAIELNKTKAGNGPYYYSIDNGKSFYKASSLNVGSGTYKLFLKNGSKCILSYPNEIIVSETKCKNTETTNSYVFNLTYDTGWELPINPEKTAQNIKIVDKIGRDVYFTEIINGSPKFWDGTANKSQFVESGLHFYIIKYEDGTTDQGTINISK